MSRFSKADAEAQGWKIVHEQEPVEEIRGGSIRTIPGNYRAEKRLPNESLISEQAETIGLLLEHIHAYQSLFEARNPSFEHSEPVQEGPVDEAGIPLRSVLTPAGALTEQEYADRGKADVLLNKFVGPTFDAAEADKAIAQHSEDVANEEAIAKARGDFLNADRPVPEGESSAEIVEVDGVKATKAAVALAEEKGINISDVEGTGKDGKVTKPDVEAVDSSDRVTEPVVEESSPEETRSAAETEKVEELGVVEAEKTPTKVRVAGGEAVQEQADEAAEEARSDVGTSEESK